MFKVNARKGEGVELAKTYGVQGYPTFILAQPDGVTLERWWGYGESTDFIATLHRGMQDPTTIDEKRARFEKAPNRDDAAKLAMYHESRDEHRDAVHYYRKAQELAPDENFSFEIFDVVASGARSDVFTLDEARAAANAVIRHDAREVVDVVRVARMMTSLGRKVDDREIMVPYLEVAVRESEGVGDKLVVRNRKYALVDHALFVEEDAAKAVQARKALLDPGWMDDPDELNGFAWWCFENEINLEEADTLARRGVDLATEGNTKANILDTLAEICNLRGSCKDEVYFIELAIQNNPDSTYFPKQLERFQKLLAEKD